MTDEALADFETFQRVVVRAGTVVRAEPFPEARRPAVKLWVSFGGEAPRRSSAQITDHYEPAALVGRQVVAVTNLPPRRIAGFESEVLVLGLPDDEGRIVLLAPDRPVPDGSRMR